MLNPTEIVDMYNCSQCSYETASAFQLNHHIQMKHRNVHTTDLFHAIVEPEQISCICCDYKSYYQFEVYEHCKQAHDSRNRSNENGSVREDFAGYNPFDSVSASSLFLIRQRDKVPSKTPQVLAEEAGGVKLVDLKQIIGARTLFKDDERAEFSTSDSSEQIVFHQCIECSYRTKKMSNFKTHMLQHASEEEISWFQCSQCSYRSKFKSNLSRHMLTHATNEEINWFQCIHCSFRSKVNTHLKKHMLNIHAADEEISWFKCKNCSYQGKTKLALKRHSLQHVSDEEISWFQCNKCSYRAKMKAYLKRHIFSKHRGKRATKRNQPRTDLSPVQPLLFVSC